MVDIKPPCVRPFSILKYVDLTVHVPLSTQDACLL